MHDQSPSPQSPVLHADEGEAIWFLGTLMQIKAGGEHTHDAYEVQISTMPPGFAPPPHIHHTQDEMFYILEGTATVMCGDETWDVAPGAFILLPRGKRHGFTVTSDVPLKIVEITSPALAMGFNHFIAAFGEPAQSLTLPPFAPPDIAKLIAISNEHHIEYVPPLDQQP
jgi:mannose-6-phosphate isomerase-like protein (cupin superfamily)